ncbi:MAG TPA: hypothetical protein VK166_10560 [Chitinophagaceae bacterium]|nr:hypothetical protein [Chitinophagaceae bacterium]
MFTIVFLASAKLTGSTKDKNRVPDIPYVQPHDSLKPIFPIRHPMALLMRLISWFPYWITPIRYSKWRNIG